MTLTWRPSIPFASLAEPAPCSHLCVGTNPDLHCLPCRGPNNFSVPSNRIASLPDQKLQFPFQTSKVRRNETLPLLHVFCFD